MDEFGDFIPLDPLGILDEPKPVEEPTQQFASLNADALGLADAPASEQSRAPGLDARPDALEARRWPELDRADQVQEKPAQPDNPAFSLGLADRAAPGLEQAAPAFKPLDPMGILGTERKPAEPAPGLPADQAPMQNRSIGAYVRKQEDARQDPANIVDLTNSQAVRRLPITDGLKTNIQKAVETVYGPGYRAQVYSGGQPTMEQGGPRVGSTRHDAGRAADVYIVGPDGQRVTGDALAPLARHWITNKLGGVGLEMKGGGIHLDEHTDRAPAWSYGSLTPAQQAVIQESRGQTYAQAAPVPSATAPQPGAGTGVPESYYRSIRTAESSGNDAARSATSSATGRYQFTEGTWNGLMRSKPDLGLTPDGRLDAAQQERAVRALTADNAAALQRNGIPVNNGTLYAAHFLGASGAVRALSADPATPMTSVVSPEAARANPFLKNMTVGSFQSWTEAKGGGGGRAPSEGTQTEIASRQDGDTYGKRLADLLKPKEQTQDEKDKEWRGTVADALKKFQKANEEPPGLYGRGAAPQGPSPNAIGLGSGGETDVASLDAQIAAMQQQAFRDPRAASQLALLQQQRNLQMMA